MNDDDTHVDNSDNKDDVGWGDDSDEIPQDNDGQIVIDDSKLIAAKTKNEKKKSKDGTAKNTNRKKKKNEKKALRRSAEKEVGLGQGTAVDKPRLGKVREGEEDEGEEEQEEQERETVHVTYLEPQNLHRQVPFVKDDSIGTEKVIEGGGKRDTDCKETKGEKEKGKEESDDLLATKRHIGQRIRGGDKYQRGRIPSRKKISHGSKESIKEEEDVDEMEKDAEYKDTREETEEGEDMLATKRRIGQRIRGGDGNRHRRMPFRKISKGNKESADEEEEEEEEEKYDDEEEDEEDDDDEEEEDEEDDDDEEAESSAEDVEIDVVEEVDVEDDHDLEAPFLAELLANSVEDQNDDSSKTGSDTVLQEAERISQTSVASDNSGIPVAVAAEDTLTAAVDARFVDLSVERGRRKRMWCLFGTLMLLAIVVTILMVALFSSGTSPPDPPQEQITTVPTQQPTPVPTFRSYDALVEQLRKDGISNLSDLDDLGSDQKVVLLLIRPYVEAFIDIDGRKLLQKYAIFVVMIRLEWELWNFTSGIQLKFDPFEDECKWPIFSCTSEGFIQSIDVFQRKDSGERVVTNIAGVIPNEIAYLSFLKTLRIVDEDVSGPLPRSLSLLSSLEVLDLGGNRVTGTILAEDGKKVPKLETLRLEKNLMTGSIPPSLYNMTELREIAVGSNLLNGSIDTAIGNLVSLQTLLVSNNSLTGTLPTQVGLLEDLVELHVDANMLSGTVPASDLAELKHLSSLQLQDNDFGGLLDCELDLPFLGGLSLDCDDIVCECCTVEEGQCK